MLLKEFRVVLVTTPDAALAEKLAAGLVETKLAACVTCIPGAVSHYRWEGKLHKSEEVQLLIKTKTGLLPALLRYIKEHHTAEVPEILSLPVTEGDKAYLDWIGANVLFSKPTDDPSLPI